MLFNDHIASPDVHIDNDRRQIRMYFHGRVRDRPGQWTACAISTDGLSFSPRDEVLGSFYFRVFRYGGYWYALSKLANTGWQQLSRSTDGLNNFENGSLLLPCARHTAVLRQGDRLLIFFSRVGDIPERILMSVIDLKNHWSDWKPSLPTEVLRPSTSYEGTQYRKWPSRFGAATHVQQVRDPFVLASNDGKMFLFYSVAGEAGIAVAEISICTRDEAR
jgi:hypothetical protein